MRPNLNTLLTDVECRINWNINDFEDLRLFVEAFNLADRIVLSDLISRSRAESLIENINFDRHKIISQREYSRFLSEDFAATLDIGFQPSKLYRLRIYSPPILDLATSLGALGIVWAILSTDFEVMGRNMERIKHFLNKQFFSAQLRILSSADVELAEFVHILLKYRKQIENLKSEIKKKRGEFE